MLSIPLEAALPTEGDGFLLRLRADGDTDGTISLFPYTCSRFLRIVVALSIIDVGIPAMRAT